jgi:hypothetical protein
MEVSFSFVFLLGGFIDWLLRPIAFVFLSWAVVGDAFRTPNPEWRTPAICKRRQTIPTIVHHLPGWTCCHREMILHW